jgi:sortase (surface protein transpeptidase)
MIKKLKAVTTLATLLTVLFVGAILTTSGPVKAGCCSAKKESKSCDKSQDKEQKKDQDQDQDKDQEQDQDKSGCSKK